MWPDRNAALPSGLACALLLALPAAAQQLYRCGNEYSQTPCTPDAKGRKVFQDNASAKPPGTTGLELCSAKVVDSLVTPDPASARVQQVGDRRMEVIQHAGASLASHRYDLRASAKTEFGVFGAPAHFSCWLSEDQARVLRVAPRNP